MKPFFHTLTLALVALAATACNSGDVTKNNTVPPIAGIVGGPDAPGGGGQVGMEIVADSTSVVPGQIVVKNLSRDVENAVFEVPAGGPDGGVAFLAIGGDVGDELRVSLEHPEEGPIERDFEIAKPQIGEVRDPEGPALVIHAGVGAQITGSGFCTSVACNTVVFDSTLIATNEEPRAGLLFFTVPGGAALGEHTVRVATAGTEGGDEEYLSAEFTVTLALP